MSSPVKCKHTNLSPSCPSCSQLKAIWEKKLSETGMVNIEQPDGLLKVWASSLAKSDLSRGKLEVMQSREEYYRAASHFLWDYKFEKPLERTIWEMHSNGISAWDISKSLNLPRMGKDTVLKVINRLAREMGVKCRN